MFLLCQFQFQLFQSMSNLSCLRAFVPLKKKKNNAKDAKDGLY